MVLKHVLRSPFISTDGFLTLSITERKTSTKLLLLKQL